MEYNIGRMGIAEGIGLAAAVTLPPIFLSMPAAMIHDAGSLAWAVPIVGGVFAVLQFFLLTYVLSKHPGDLLSVIEKLLGKAMAYLIGAFYFFVLLGFSIIWTREFAEYTMLTALPYVEFDLITACFIGSAAVIMYAGIESICRAIYIILPFNVIGVLLLLVMLIPVYRLYYLFPWQGNGLAFLIKPVLTQIGLSSPLFILPLLAKSFQTVRTIEAAIVFGYGMSTVIRSISIAAFIMSFGVAAAIEKTMPFYEMARLIHLNRYLQRFESLFIIIWVITGVFAIALCLYGAMAIGAKLFKLPTINPLIPPMAVVVAQAASLPPDTYSVLTLEATIIPYVFAPGIIGIPMLLFVAATVKKGDSSCRGV